MRQYLVGSRLECRCRRIFPTRLDIDNYRDDRGKRVTLDLSADLEGGVRRLRSIYDECGGIGPADPCKQI
jgi:hypothetical protein